MLGLPAFLIIVAVVVILLVMTAQQGGRSAREPRLCRTCGTTHPPFAQYCRRCGKKL